jgi:protein-S-isoprenylcysteine O-methyltransferase Ste14
MAIDQLIISAFWLVFIIYWIVSAFKAKKTIHRSSSSYLIRLAVIIVLLAVLQSNAFQNFDAAIAVRFSSTLGVIGIIVCAVGVTIAIWARRYLGKNWGMPMSIKENPDLVTSGPYKYIRHPIYAGVLLAMLGSAMVGEGVWLVVIVLVFPYFILFSAKKEEENMTKLFPTQYPEYKKKTKMLIPFVL